MLVNVIITVLFVLVIAAYATLNVSLVKEALDRELTFAEIIAENQDTRLGKIFMCAVSIPAFVVLQIQSLCFNKEPINTTSCFYEEKDNELTAEQIREK